MNDRLHTIFSALTCLAGLLCIVFGVSSAYAHDYSYYRDQCAPIRHDVENILSAEGITPDYFYLLVAESHCKDTTSKAGAVGYWQMLPATAREYGCNDPHDLVCETKAAAKYLAHLERKCGVENVVFCWHDGGSNWIRHGRVASKAARGLDWQFRYFMRTDKPQE